MSDIDVRLDPPLSVVLVIVPNFSLASLALCADGLRDPEGREDQAR